MATFAKPSASPTSQPREKKKKKFTSHADGKSEGGGIKRKKKGREEKKSQAGPGEKGRKMLPFLLPSTFFQSDPCLLQPKSSVPSPRLERSPCRYINVYPRQLAASRYSNMPLELLDAGETRRRARIAPAIIGHVQVFPVFVLPTRGSIWPGGVTMGAAPSCPFERKNQASLILVLYHPRLLLYIPVTMSCRSITWLATPRALGWAGTSVAQDSVFFFWEQPLHRQLGLGIGRATKRAFSLPIAELANSSSRQPRQAKLPDQDFQRGGRHVTRMRDWAPVAARLGLGCYEAGSGSRCAARLGSVAI
ncbi:hypothetical protein GGR52DRAFT_251842 [Hypoxylon sp. FL1284]|nr:hypothetical protein GGR52DRAFT_251842 [Hypoxylon sp. FL1284]